MLKVKCETPKSLMTFMTGIRNWKMKMTLNDFDPS